MRELKTDYTRWQFIALLMLRLAIGWHFLYEGIAKILNPRWTSMAYLLDAQGFLADFYHSLAENAALLSGVDWANKAGLTLIGLSLITGCLTKWGSMGGILLLLLYYLSHIPYVGAEYLLPSEGAYLIIDKNIIEMFGLLVIIQFPTSHILGIDRWLVLKKSLRKWV